MLKSVSLLMLLIFMSGCTAIDTKLIQKVQSSCPDGVVERGIVNLTHAPMDIDKIELINPMGLMIGGHVTPIDHQYYYKKPGLAPYYVKATADGVITSIEAMPNSNNSDYRIILYHTCKLYSIYIHVNTLSAKLLETVGSIPAGQAVNPSIKVKAGEVIGEITNQQMAFDYSLHDEQVILPGFIVPEHYEAEPWKIHTLDPYDYFVEPLRTKLLAKNPRTAEPLGGKIDYDIDGKLIGNWFKEGTNGYASGLNPYWQTHFAAAPNAYDPSHIILSIGDFNGQAQQFSVVGNAPDPSKVNITTGLVKYELVDTQYFVNGQPWNKLSFAKNIVVTGASSIKGVVLVQLVTDRKIRLEIFPGKAANQVNGFTNKSMVYVR